MELRAIGQQDFRALGKRFRKAANGAELRRNLTRRIQGELKTVVADVQAAVKQVDSKGVRGGGARARERASTRKRAPRGGHGLRASVARSVKSRIKYSGITVGVRISVDSSKMPPGQRKLPKYLASEKGWRHPVYGHGRWVRQTGQDYWYRTIRRRIPDIRRAVDEAVHDTLKELGG